jgi:hypothetical protein
VKCGSYGLRASKPREARVPRQSQNRRIRRAVTSPPGSMGGIEGGLERAPDERVEQPTDADAASGVDVSAKSSQARLISESGRESSERFRWAERSTVGKRCAARRGSPLGGGGAEAETGESRSGAGAGGRGESAGGPRAGAVQGGGDGGSRRRGSPPLLSGPPQASLPQWRERDGPGTRQGASAKGVGGKPWGVWGGAARGANRDRERVRADGDDRRGVPATIHMVSVRMPTEGAGSGG